MIATLANLFESPDIWSATLVRNNNAFRYLEIRIFFWTHVHFLNNKKRKKILVAIKESSIRTNSTQSNNYELQDSTSLSKWNNDDRIICLINRFHASVIQKLPWKLIAIELGSRYTISNTIFTVGKELSWFYGLSVIYMCIPSGFSPGISSYALAKER